MSPKKKTTQKNHDFSVNGEDVIAQSKVVFNEILARKLQISKDKKIILDLPLLIVIVFALLLAPFTIFALLLAFFTGHTVSITKN